MCEKLKRVKNTFLKDYAVKSSQLKNKNLARNTIIDLVSYTPSTPTAIQNNGENHKNKDKQKSTLNSLCQAFYISDLDSKIVFSRSR